jgi:hypothetical protein
MRRCHIVSLSQCYCKRPGWSSLRSTMKQAWLHLVGLSHGLHARSKLSCYENLESYSSFGRLCSSASWALEGRRYQYGCDCLSVFLLFAAVLRHLG